MNSGLKSLVVFCGSKEGKKSAFQDAARCLGITLAERNIDLVYGGSKTGLMGIVAKSVLEGGGNVIGIIPEFMVGREIVLPNLSELIIVDSLYERKAQMERLSDASLTMPGGFGTMDELFEMLTWKQLNLHNKPIRLWNVDKFYDSLLKLMNEMLGQGFLTQETRDLIVSSDDLNDLLDSI